MIRQGYELCKSDWDALLGAWFVFEMERPSLCRNKMKVGSHDFAQQFHNPIGSSINPFHIVILESLNIIGRLSDFSHSASAQE